MKAKDYRSMVESYPIEKWPSVWYSEEKLTSVSMALEHQRILGKYKRHIQLVASLTDLSNFDLQFIGDGLAIGVDEAGRGPLAGPVVAAACIIRVSDNLLGLNDSKKLSQAQREHLYRIITTEAIAYGVGCVSHTRIDEINILNATKEAMHLAISGALKQLCDKGLAFVNAIDQGIVGPIGIITDHVKLTGYNYPMLAEVKGDQKSLAVAAASIIAKVTRDHYMENEGIKFPDYGFQIHKGYGTPMHYNAIRAHGVSPIHRHSFLKNFLPTL